MRKIKLFPLLNVRYASNKISEQYQKRKRKKEKEKKRIPLFFFRTNDIPRFRLLMLPLRHPSFYFRNHIRGRGRSPSVRIHTKACSVIYLEQPCLEYGIGRARVETRLSPPAMRTRCLHSLLNRRISQR